MSFMCHVYLVDRPPTNYSWQTSTAWTLFIPYMLHMWLPNDIRSIGGEYPLPSLSSCSINPQGNSLSEDQEDAGIMLPLLSTIRSRAPLLQELDLGSYNISGFVVHRNWDFSEGWKELGDGFKMLMNHDNVYNYPWRGLAQSADQWICFERLWRTSGCCWKNAQSLYIYLGDHLGSLTIPGLCSPSTYCKHRQFWLRIGCARLYTTLHQLI